MKYQLYHNDVIKWAKEYDGPPFHAMFCDPPYHLTSIVKRFGKPGAAEAKGDVYNRASKGFMGQQWDGGELAFKPETWEALGQHLYPGGFGMAFASSRGWHRMAVAIEDAGLIIHPSIFGWVYLSGFPKNTKVTLRAEGDNSPFCQCGRSPRQFAVSGFQDNAPDETNIDEDSRSDYLLSDHLYDELPRQEQGSAPNTEPLPNDAPKHNHSFGPLIETQQGSEPLHSPYQAQYTDPLPKPDYSHPSSNRPVSLSLRGYEGEPDSSALADTIRANAPDSTEESCQSLGISESDTSAHHKQRKNNLDDTLHFGSSHKPFVESHKDNTTKEGFCQNCGKVKKEVWEGRGYGLQALKPALEPIIVFQRPYEGRPVDSIVATGAGALWIEGGRIPTNGETPKGSGNPCPNGNADIMSRALGKDGPNITPEAGRWPSNFVLQHSPACNGTCAPDCPVRLFDEQAGELGSHFGEKGAINIGQMAGLAGERGNRRGYSREGGYDDSGPASRMFHRSDWAYEVAEQLANAEPVKYEPKASSTEREAGLDSLETQTRHRVNAGGLENEPRFSPAQVKNIHPTIKPIAGNKYFATLLLPPAEYTPRRILIPFAGAGSEMIGAILAGWDEVIGIEAEANYIQIAEARLKWWSQWPGWGQRDVDTILQASGQNGQQLSFLDSQ